MRTRSMRTGFLVCAALLPFVLVCTACAPLKGQERPSRSSQQETRSSQEILTRFVAERGSPDGRATAEIIDIFVDPGKYPQTTVDALLDGLEHLALTSADSLIRSAAASKIGMAGWSSRKPPLPGIVARQVRLYRRSSDPMVRARIVSSLTGAAETQAAAAFLRTIALQSSRRGDFPNAPIAAIRALTRLGEDGPATLRELHQSGQVHDREASAFLAQLSKTGYRLRS
ncbi:MAG: hypothetical protein AB1941_09730 [Gemmatimonadota bacterium]